MRYLVLALFALLVLQQVNAANYQNYQLDLTPLDTSIFPNDTATFKLLITNFDHIGHSFQVYTLDPSWVLRIEPNINIVQPDTVSEYTLYVKPKVGIGIGSQATTVLIKNLENDVIQKQNIIIFVQDPNNPVGIYQPSVELKASIAESIDPRSPFRINLNFRNRNFKNISGMVVQINSAIFGQQYSMNLDPLGETNRDILFNLDPYQTAGTYPVTVTLIYQNKTINELKSSFTIQRIEDVAVATVDTGRFLKSTTELRIENKGNANTTYLAKLPTSFSRLLFTSTYPKSPSTLIGGERFYTWNLTLAPKEQVSVQKTENYQLLAILVVLAVLGIISYFLLRSPVIAIKEAISVKEDEEGTTSVLKVRIFIKNRTGKSLEGVNVIDRIPSIATYLKQETLGVVNPSKVVTNEKGTMLKWELDILEPYEERIINYSLKSTLKILGKMHLPNAKIHFTTRTGKERVAYTKAVVYSE